jgi:ribonuclease Z
VKFDVTILGCGAATPTLRYQPTAQILNIIGNWILLDAGEGVQKSLRAQKVPFQKINRIFISHMHGDHVLGLPGLVGSMNLLGRTKPLFIHGPASLERWLMECLRLTESYLKFEINFRPNQKDKQSCAWEDGEIVVDSTPVKHRIEAYAYRFQWSPNARNVKKAKIESLDLKRSEIILLKKDIEVQREDGTLLSPDDVCHPMGVGRSYVFSGDTAPCSNLTSLAAGANLLYHESTFAESLLDKAKQTGHSTARQAAQTAKEAGVKRLLLGHFSSRYRSLTVLLNEARQLFEDSELAVEGTSYTLHDLT